MSLVERSNRLLTQAGKSVLVFLFILAIIPGLNETFMLYLGAIVAIFAVANYDPDLNSWEENYLPRNHYLTALGALMVLGFALRVYSLGSQSFWMDEAITANATLGFLEHGIPIFPSGFTYFRSLPQTMVSAFSVSLLGNSEFAFRLPSVIFGTLSILLTYLLARDMFNQEVAIISAALITLSYWNIAWSRQARMYPLLQLFYTWAILLVYRLRKKIYRILPYLITVTTLAIMTHRLAYAILPATAGYLVLLWLDYQVLNRRESVWIAILYVIAATVIGGFYTVRGQAQLTIYLKWFQASLGPVFALALAGIGISLSKKKFQSGSLLLFFFSVPLIYLSSNLALLASRYMYFTAPIVFIWASLTIWKASEWISEGIWKILDTGVRKEFIAVLVVLLVLISFMSSGLYTANFQKGYDLGINAPQPDFRKAHQYVEKHRSSDSALICGWMPPCVYYGGEPDYWLAFDLTGTDNYPIREGKEFYSGAEPIRSPKEFLEVIKKEEKGWIVLDDLAVRKQIRPIRMSLSSFKNHNIRAEGMNVLSWDRTNSTK